MGRKLWTMFYVQVLRSGLIEVDYVVREGYTRIVEIYVKYLCKRKQKYKKHSPEFSEVHTNKTV